MQDSEFFGSERVSRILLKIAPPVMLGLLIQALYNIVDSFFVGRYSTDALTALTVVYPLQLIIVALAVGTGVGVNTYMARKYAQGQPEDAEKAAGTSTVLSVVSWIVFGTISVLIMEPYVRTSSSTPAAVCDAITYGNIVCVGSLGTLLEGGWSKVHQSRGNMKIPMLAQVAGAMTNIILDPILIFGMGPCPEMGVAGAGFATVVGQFLSAVIVGVGGFHRPPKFREIPFYASRIYFYGYSSILMQALYTVYIVALNMILAKFSDAAVTVLGLYYKMQSFFFIPLFGLTTCIVPVISFNYARGCYGRCREVMTKAFLISLVFMVVGIVSFVGFPAQTIGLFSSSPEVHAIGAVAFPIIGSSFVFAVFSLMTPVFFQAIGKGLTSLMLTLLRQIFTLLPVFWFFSLIGLNYTWIAFPVAEFTAGSVGLFLYRKTVRRWNAAAPLLTGN